MKVSILLIGWLT